ncbi:ligase-associated DNA damage response exonuclease [Hoeflea poritis]|uniref:Ligase-associated DNA damage response exonuclease n=1 Tax=Hoeflea poritis TaxID=2993659 RepID=A0ABT4VJW4_9HYPH|nr:ligase-associated DNA damage response exonuclease [Hoeflea poritis]MDA4844961.1 ligase-associated DNA damage response exonuclease [Hoeflea poritis]
MALLEFTDRGIFCRQADVYIDPWKPVERALITHGHADHARPGHGTYLCTEAAAPVIRLRLGDIALETVSFGETRTINGVDISFHPAGHIPGSAQIRMEYKGEVWVVSGDYKVRPDNLSEPFEPIRCHTFISECTFGLPVFKWRPQEDVLAEINDWWRENAEAGRTSVLGAYSLGKAQRLLAGIDEGIGPIYTHGAVENTNAVLRAQGLSLPDTTLVTDEQSKGDYGCALIIAPPGALGSNWMRRFPKASTGFASGWMAMRGVRRRRAVDRGFVLSDHCDWTELNEAIAATGAENTYVTHGYTEIFRRWLEERGYHARIVETEFRGDDLEEPAEGEGASA